MTAVSGVIAVTVVPMVSAIAVVASRTATGMTAVSGVIAVTVVPTVTAPVTVSVVPMATATAAASVGRMVIETPVIASPTAAAMTAVSAVPMVTVTIVVSAGRMVSAATATTRSVGDATAKQRACPIFGRCANDSARLSCRPTSSRKSSTASPACSSRRCRRRTQTPQPCTSP